MTIRFGKAGREAIEYLVSENVLHEIDCVRGQSGSIAKASAADLTGNKATLTGYVFDKEKWSRVLSRQDEIDEPGGGEDAQEDVQGELGFE